MDGGDDESKPSYVAKSKQASKLTCMLTTLIIGAVKLITGGWPLFANVAIQSNQENMLTQSRIMWC